jgi:hypothetical protein
MTDIGRIEATLTARFDSDPFDRYDRALDGAQRDARKPVEAQLRGDYDGAQFDKYGRELDSAQREARKGATAKLDARADTGQLDRYDRKLNEVDGRQTRATTSSAGLAAGMGSMMKTAGLAAGAAGLAAVALSAKVMYDEQAEAQAVGAQLEAVLRSTGGAAKVTAGEVEALAESLGKKTAQDDEAIMAGANILLTFTKVRNEVGKGNDVFSRAVATTSDVSRAFGKDLPAASIMLGKALNDPVAGISAMSRVGIQFTDGQKDMIEKMVESGDQLGAQKVILGELEKQVGGSAEAYSKTLPGAIDRTKNAFNNLMEEWGGKLAPAVSGIADALTGVLDGSAFKGGGAASVLRPLGEGVTAIWNAIKPVFGQIGGAFREVFGGKNGAQTKRDLATIAQAIGDALKALAPVVRKAVSQIGPYLTGLLRVWRGVIRVIAGLIRGDWSQVWQGAKDIVLGGLKAIGALLTNMTLPIRTLTALVFGKLAEVFRAAWSKAKEVVRDAARAVVDAVRDKVSAARSAASAIGKGIVSGFTVLRSIPGKVRSAIGSAVDAVRGFAGAAGSAGASIGSAIINGIGSGLSAAGGFIANIGRQIADWINASTPFGDSIKIGPVSVTLPALAQGGKVGPSLRGAQLFIAGEGGKDEWVISQEGDRRKNIGWAVEALEQLTGRAVGLHKSGKGSAAVKRAKAKLPGKWQTKVTRETTKIDRMERAYGQQEREADFTDEEFLVSNDDGSITIDQRAVTRRLNELEQLRRSRKKIYDAVAALLRWIKTSERPIRQAIKALRKAAGGQGKSKAGKKKAAAYRGQAREYEGGLNALLGAVPDLGLDLEDQRLNLAELDNERAAIGDLDSQTRPPDVDPNETPEGLAALAAAQLAELQQNRREMFASFGGNFISAGASLSDLDATAGFRYFGAGQGDGGAGVLASAGGTTASLFSAAGAEPGAGAGGGAGGSDRAPVQIVNNYAAPPPDPHSWSAGIAWELRAGVG